MFTPVIIIDTGITTCTTEPIMHEVTSAVVEKESLQGIRRILPNIVTQTKLIMLRKWEYSGSYLRALKSYENW